MKEKNFSLTKADLIVNRPALQEMLKEVQAEEHHSR